MANGRKKPVLNMGAVQIIDSAGLGTLVGLHQSAVSCKTTLQLCNLSAMHKEFLQITRLLTVFNISPTEDHAVRALSQSE